jgi:hypothetical protein
MILQEEFKNSGYRDILDKNIASEYKIKLEDIFDAEQKPEELLGIYISKQRDELFFLLDGNSMDIGALCDRWDDKIRVFTIINSKTEMFQKLKYNMVQLVVYSGTAPDKSREGDLLISRKIIIEGDMADKNNIEIDDDEAIELPFHMIPTDEFKPDEGQMERLSQLLPADKELLALMGKKQKKANKKEREGVLDKSFSVQDYEKIKEWLKR